MIKKIALLIVLSLFIGSLVGCSNIDTMKRIKDTNQVIWGTNAAFAPFEMREGDKVIGIDAEIAQRIADKLGVQLKVVDTEFDSLPAALKSGEIDFIAAGYTVNEERQKSMTFSDKYFKAVQVIIVREDNTDITNLESLKGKKVGVQTGTTGDLFVVTPVVGEENVFRYNNGVEAVLDLKNGNLDAVVIDNLPAQMLVEQNPGLKILDEKAAEEEEYAIAVRKGDEEFVKIINEVLAEMKANGEIDALVNKYSLELQQQ